MLERGFEFAPGYRLEVFLGRGQFGQVWQVTAPGGTTTAVKFIDLAEGQWEKEYEGIRRVKQIRHANLMPIIAIWLLDAEGKVLEETAPDSQEALDTVDIDEVDRSGDWVLSHQGRDSARWLAVAMLLGGKNLLQRLKECKEAGSTGIPVKELLSYMEESAKGLDFLNSRVHDFGSGTTSLQHCDIKPANIVLIGSSAVICDFGLARLMARDQVTATSVAGTPAYMAPEAIGGKPSRTSDQYSLAVTYYQLRTGKLPLSDGSLWEVLDAHRLGNLRFDDVPEREREVLRRATSLEWEKRFDSNQEMVEALRDAIRTETTLPAIPPIASPSSFRRYGTIGLVALALLVPIAIYSWPAPKEEAVVADDSDSQEETDTTVDATNGDEQSEEDSVVVAQQVQAALAAVDVDASEAMALFKQLLDADPSVAQLMPIMLVGHQQDVVHSRIVGENEDVLITAGDEQQLRRFDLARLSEATATNQPKELIGVALEGHTNLIDVLAVSPEDKRWTASGGFDSKVLIWDAQSSDGKPSGELSGHQGDITAIAWHPKKPFLITASGDNQIGIWSLEIKNGAVNVDASKSKIFGVPRAIEKLAFDSWGETLVCTDVVDHALGAVAWEAVESALRRDEDPKFETFSSPRASIGTFCLADAPVADTLVVSGGITGEVGFGSLKERTLIHREPRHEGRVIVCKVQGQGEQRVVVTGDDRGELFFWRGDRPALSLPGHRAMIRDLDISDDGRWLAVAAYDGMVSLRDLADPTRFLSIEPAERGPLKTVQLDPSGRWLFAGGSGGRLYAWDLRRAKLLTWTRPTETLPSIEHDEDPVPRPKRDLVTQRQEEYHRAPVYAAAATFALWAPEKAP